MAKQNPSEVWEEYIWNTMQMRENYLICDECRSYIEQGTYWEINGEVLCDDCARMKYQRGIRGL